MCSDGLKLSSSDFAKGGPIFGPSSSCILLGRPPNKNWDPWEYKGLPEQIWIRDLITQNLIRGIRVGSVIDQVYFRRHSNMFEVFRGVQLSQKFRKVLRRILERIRRFEVLEALFLYRKAKDVFFLLFLGSPFDG